MWGGGGAARCWRLSHRDPCVSSHIFATQRMSAEQRISITLMWLDSSLAIGGNPVRRKALVSLDPSVYFPRRRFSCAFERVVVIALKISAKYCCYHMHISSKGSRKVYLGFISTLQHFLPPDFCETMLF